MTDTPIPKRWRDTVKAAKQLIIDGEGHKMFLNSYVCIKLIEQLGTAETALTMIRNASREDRPMDALTAYRVVDAALRKVGL